MIPTCVRYLLHLHFTVTLTINELWNVCQQVYIARLVKYQSRCVQIQKVDARRAAAAESPSGISTFVGGNISVAIISVIRRLIVPDRSSIHEHGQRSLFYSYVLIRPMDQL